MNTADSTLTKSQITKAGKALRDAIRHGRSLDEIRRDSTFTAPLEILRQLRAETRPLMLRTNVDVRRAAEKVGGNYSVTQRLKRVERILGKLARPNAPDLARLGDIGGIRAVVPTLEMQARLVANLQTQFGRSHAVERVTHVSDYVAKPRSSGYRAVHLVVARSSRLVEIQIRTERQDLWAQLVERISRDLGKEFKVDEAPPELEAFFLQLSEYFKLRDEGAAIPMELEELYVEYDSIRIHMRHSND